MHKKSRKWTAGILIMVLCISILFGGEVALGQIDQAIPAKTTTSQTLEKRLSPDPTSLTTPETTTPLENSDSVEQGHEKAAKLEPDQEKQENQQNHKPQKNSDYISNESPFLTPENELTLDKETVEKILQEQETKQAVTISLTSERSLPQEELHQRLLITTINIEVS